MDPTGTPEVARGASRQSSSPTFQLHSQLATERDLAGDNIRTYSLMPNTKIDVYKMFIFFHNFFLSCFTTMTFGKTINYHCLICAKLLKLFLVTRN